MPESESEPTAAYLQLPPGELQRRADEAWRRLQSCSGCARGCGVNRLESSREAACHTGRLAVVSGCNPHFGEEDPLVGSGGSGTIFFSWCNLECQFCQNADISQHGIGREVAAEELAAMMLALQEQGCHNINLVSPSHVVAQILQALVLAAAAGLQLPLVYNTGGYDALSTLALLDGIVDLYMPDMKYADAAIARRYSLVEDYPQVNQAAVQAMHHQVGDLEMDDRGVARHGLLVRHLVLPEQRAGTGEIVRFLRDQVSPHTYLNVMAQYRPCHRASALPPLDRAISNQEYAEALSLASDAGLRLDQRRRYRLAWL